VWQAKPFTQKKGANFKKKAQKEREKVTVRQPLKEMLVGKRKGKKER